MPRVARFNIAAIEDLLRQLEYAPAEAKRRQMDAAERLVADLEPDQLYPEDFIIYRITGYRLDQMRDPVTFVGEALRADLTNLVQFLSEDLELSPTKLERPAITIEQVAAHLRVSQKTVQRYRKQGLVCHYIVFEDGVKRLGCFVDALERFAGERRPQLQKAANFSRVNGLLEAQIIEQARQMRERENLSLNEAALRIAQQVGRAHETIRMMLRRHDRKAEQPIFVERGPLRDRDIRVIHRAWQRGVEVKRLAQRFGKTKTTINRAINRRRRDLLRSLSISFVQLPTFDLPEAEDVILTGPHVTSGLPARGFSDAIELVAAAKAAGPHDEQLEQALVAACNLLKRRAVRGIDALGEWPTAAELDAIESGLRWTSLLQRRLILLGVPAAIPRIEQNLHCKLAEQPADEVIALVELAVHVIARTVDGLDPTRGQRLHRMVALAMEKELAKIVMPQTSGRAAVRHARGSMPMRDPTQAMNAWDSSLNLRGDLQVHVESLGAEDRALIERRFGLSGTPPLTMSALAEQAKMSPIKTARVIQRAIRELRRTARAEDAR